MMSADQNVSIHWSVEGGLTYPTSIHGSVVWATALKHSSVTDNSPCVAGLLKKLNWNMLNIVSERLTGLAGQLNIIFLSIANIISIYKYGQIHYDNFITMIADDFILCVSGCFVTLSILNMHRTCRSCFRELAKHGKPGIFTLIRLAGFSEYIGLLWFRNHIWKIKLAI